MAFTPGLRLLVPATSLTIVAGPLLAEPTSSTALVAGTVTATPAETADDNVLALSREMFGLYATTSEIFQRNPLAQHPAILSLLSGAGGRFVLYRPGQPPLEAPVVPLAYQLLKSPGHSTVALSEVVALYLNNAASQAGRQSLLAYRSRMQSTLDATDMPTDWRPTVRMILNNNIALMDRCAAQGAVSTADLQSFADKQAPVLKKVVALVAQTQVNHWMDVIAQWKQMLGPAWDKTCAASNTIYVARQNNVLFSVLAQFFGPEAINDRLLLIETISFITTPQDLLELVTRIISDRSVGALFFKNYHLIDYELMGGDGREVILAQDKQRDITPTLPPAVPFGSRQFPTLISSGAGPTSLVELH